MKKPALISLLILVVLLLLRFYFYFSSVGRFYDGQNVSFQTTILSDPKQIGSLEQFTATVAGNRITVSLPSYPGVSYGDQIAIRGKITVKRVDDRQIYELKNGEVQILPEENLILSTIAEFRQKIIDSYSFYLPRNQAGLLLGIVFGIKANFPSHFYQNLRNAGVLHVIAASGMNISMVGGFLSGLLGIFLRRRWAIALTIVGILFYALLAGLQASIIRATIMGILAFSAQILGRQSLALFSLALTGVIMLFIDPSLLFDVGFQLSFMATLGLVSLKPFLDRSKIGLVSQKSLIGEDLLTTIVAQTSTLPILVLTFGTYSIWSTLVNLLVLWTVPILMFIGGVSALFILVLGNIGGIILYLSIPILSYFEAIVNFFGNLPGTVILSQVPWQFGAAYYLIVLIFFLRLQKSKNEGESPKKARINR